MLIYLLLTVNCAIKEPAKTFQLKCTPKVEQFYLTESECKAKQTASSTCLTVNVNKGTK